MIMYIFKEWGNMDKYTGEYLYHYTTVESLALILNNKTMRFSDLNNVDDLE